MALHRKHSFVDTFVSYDSTDDLGSTAERRWRRASGVQAPRMNKLIPFFGGNKNDAPECYNHVRYIRDACKVFSDLWKTDKDFLNKSIDGDVSKSFKEFRLSDTARAYKSPYKQNGAQSVLNITIDDIITIHDQIDLKRRAWFDQLKKLNEEARDKQSVIRQTMAELRENFDRAHRKLETAEANLKKFSSKADHTTIPNYDERYQDLDDIRIECEQARTVARDIYATETYRIANEEHAITQNVFAQYLFQEQSFYKDIDQYLSKRIPEIQHRLDHNDLAPSFHCDISEHCLNRIYRPIAYPIETCIRLLEKSVHEEGLFRIAPSLGKQKKLVAQLDLQTIDQNTTLHDLGYDPHVVASALKQYLRELPDCLLTEELSLEWNEAASHSTDEDHVQRIAHLINRLPKVNYDNLCYLVQFLTRVEEHSADNKMTASNLGICIGCSLLYPKEQSLNASMPNLYTNGPTILELMIKHHKELFEFSHQGEIQQDLPPPYQPYQPSQPDIIPTGDSKSRTGSAESLLNLHTPSDIRQPSPTIHHKQRAPPPPPSQPVLSRMNSLNNQQAFYDGIPKEQYRPEQTSKQNSTVSHSNHRRNGSGGTVIDRYSQPPPLPSEAFHAPQARPRPSHHNNGHERSSPRVDNETSSASKINPRGVMTELHNRTTDSHIQTSEVIDIWNNTASSPGEITQF